jgi:hypothetical protein
MSTDGEAVRAKSKWHVTDWSGNVFLGEYDAVVVRHGDGWRIAERIVAGLFGVYGSS